jgi:UDPglucose 6-dehydrogenase
VIEAVEEINNAQKRRIVEKLREKTGRLDGKTIALWGLSFKPETDDMREAPSLVVVDALLEAGARVVAFDPAALNEARRIWGDRIETAPNMYAAAEGADALVLLTEWKQFRLPDWEQIRASMRGNVLIDGRNIYDPAEMRALGFDYSGIGK